MRLRSFYPLCCGVLALVSPLAGHASPVAAAANPRPVTSAVPLAKRPDIAALFAPDLAGLQTQAAASMSRTATEHLGAISPALAVQLGRSVYYRPTDVALYAVPAKGRPDDKKRSNYSVVAVPLHAVVHSDGSVSPPPSPKTGLVDPTFTEKWGQEEYFTWELRNLDDGGVLCPNTVGVVRGQWEYARLPGVPKSSKYDYWGVAQRAVAQITQDARNCDDTIDWFLAEMQSKTKGAYGARQSPLSQADGTCVKTDLQVKGEFFGISVAITQPVQKCERWYVEGALAAKGLDWYGIRYDNQGVWNKVQRESAALQILASRGGGLGLNTKLDLDVDNR